jgi:hypothetical protein
MAIFTKIEFAHALNMGRSSVSNWIKRGQLFVNDDGKIDDQDPRNRKKIDARLKKIGGNYLPPAEIQESRTIELKERRAKKKEVAPKVERLKRPKISKSDDLDDQKKKAEIKFKLSQIELNELKSAKLKGENVPTKMVEGLFIMLGSQFQTQYRDATENLLSELAHECKIGNKMHAKYKDLFIKMINKEHSESVEVVQKELKAAASEASGKIAMEND